MSIEDKAELFMAVRNYKCEERKKWNEGVDLTASDILSDEKILLRLIEPRAKTGFVGVDAVRKMSEVMKSEEYDKGFLVGKRFTEAAEQEMTEQNIQRISDDYMPPITQERLYVTINDYVNDLCKTKCGEAPQKESDCEGYSEGHSCMIRIISDNASFHFERGWMNLLKNDFKKLVSIQDTIKVQ
jgi:hypothetical protein